MKKKILQVVNIPFVLPYYFGNQMVFLKEKGFSVTVACSPGEDLDKFCEKYQLGKEEIDILRRIDLKTDVISLIKLIRLIRRERFDYVIGHTPKGGLLAMLAARIAGVKHRIYFRHGIVYATTKGMKKQLMVALERLTSACATKIVSVSKSVLQYSNKNRINSPQKNVLLNQGTCNGVDFERFKRTNDASKRYELEFDKNDIVVGYVGRLVNDKGINELIDAWKIVKEYSRNVRLLLVGPLEDRDALPTSVKDYILEDPTISFTGLVEDTVPYYELMDIFVLPSYREGFPTVVLEASGMELPVITTRAMGCIDSIEEDITGVFTDISPEAIAQKILYYIRNGDVRRNHGKAGQAWVRQNFDQKVVWAAIESNLLD